MGGASSDRWMILICAAILLAAAGCGQSTSYQRKFSLPQSLPDSDRLMEDAVAHMQDIYPPQRAVSQNTVTWSFNFKEHVGFQGWVSWTRTTGNIEMGVWNPAPPTPELRQTARRLLSDLVYEMNALLGHDKLQVRF